ncbi:MAG: RNA polymerase sigma factor [Clostridia bacterium]|nr:RNA polymerase sigma factor [Clostridia bacterium]
MENYELINLINHALEHDPEATELLYEEFYSEVYFICFNILSSKEDAEDITQDTFIEAFTNLDSMKQPLSFKNWLGRIAANKSINFLKKRNRISLKDDDELDVMGESDEFESSFENKVIEADVYQTLIEIIQKLPEEQKMVVFLFYYQEMSVKEIAELCSCSENTVKSRLRYARLFMKKEIEKYEDEGYKLRCIVLLPFMFALFKAYRDNINVSTPCAIIPALLSKSSGSAAETETNHVTKEIVKSNVKRKVIKLSKVAKIGIAGVAAAVVVSGGVIAAVMAGCGNSEPESSAVSASSVDLAEDESVNESSLADKESTVSEQESSEAVPESSEESEAPKAEMTWKFKQMEPPKPQIVEYVTTKTDAGDVITATPSIVVDMEAAEKAFKEYSKFSSLTFADLECEQRDYDDERSAEKRGYDEEDYDDKNGIRYIYETGITGYDSERYQKNYTSLDDYNVRFTSTQTYSQYNGPEKYFIQLNYTDITQDETYDLLSRIFGEEIAEYLVYCEMEDGHKSDTYNNIYAAIPLDDNEKSKYIFERDFSILETGEEFINFTVELVDKNVTGYGYSDGAYDHFENNYTGMKLPVEISDIFDSKYGGTDLGDPAKLFDKTFSYGGSFDKYQFTHMRRLNVDTITYNDGSVYSHIFTDCYRMSVAADEDTKYKTEMEATFDIIKNADGSIDIQKINMSCPTTFHHYDEDNFAVLDDMLELTQQQVIDVLGIDKSLLGKVSGDEDYKMISVSEVPIKLFGQVTEVDLTLSAGESANDYYSEFKIE